MIPFRYPYAQANSLLNQHLNLSTLQGKDEFVKDYMDFLVHHEFGLSHKIAIFDYNPSQINASANINTLEYWLMVWYLFYKKAFDIYSEKPGFHFFCYEEFCKHPTESLKTVFSLLDIPTNYTESLEIESFDARS